MSSEGSETGTEDETPALDMRKSSDRRRLHGNTLAAESVQKLYERPRPLESIPKPSPTMRQELVGILKHPVSTAQSKTRPGQNTASPIAYLYGDERRAVRVFIEENTEYVAACMEETSSPLAHGWPEPIWNMCCEEWQFYEAGFDEDGGDEP